MESSQESKPHCNNGGEEIQISSMAMILLARERIQIESFTDNRADKMNKPLFCGTRIYPILKTV